MTARKAGIHFMKKDKIMTKKKKIESTENV
jgi:hypothetical protein